MRGEGVVPPYRLDEPVHRLEGAKKGTQKRGHSTFAEKSRMSPFSEWADAGAVSSVANCYTDLDGQSGLLATGHYRERVALDGGRPVMRERVVRHHGPCLRQRWRRFAGFVPRPGTAALARRRGQPGDTRPNTGESG